MDLLHTHPTLETIVYALEHDMQSPPKHPYIGSALPVKHVPTSIEMSNMPLGDPRQKIDPLNS